MPSLLCSLYDPLKTGPSIICVWSSATVQETARELQEAADVHYELKMESCDSIPLMRIQYGILVTKLKNAGYKRRNPLLLSFILFPVPFSRFQQDATVQLWALAIFFSKLPVHSQPSKQDNRNALRWGGVSALRDHKIKMSFASSSGQGIRWLVTKLDCNRSIRHQRFLLRQPFAENSLHRSLRLHKRQQVSGI